MRLRTDSWHIAGWKRSHELLGACPGDGHNHVAHDAKYSNIEPAQPGDVWALLGFMNRPETAGGFALTCPVTTCEQGVHGWGHAYDCAAGKSPDSECKAGAGRTSWWTWSGDPESGSLTASPSLMIMLEINGVATGACGFHGFLQNGVLA